MYFQCLRQIVTYVPDGSLRKLKRSRPVELHWLSEVRSCCAYHYTNSCCSQREAFVLSTLQRTNSHPIQFSPLQCGDSSVSFHLFIHSASVPANEISSPWQPTLKSLYLSWQSTSHANPCGATGPKQTGRRGGEGSRSGEGSCVFSVDHSGLLGFGWKADTLEMLFPSKFRLWKTHCVVPFKPNGRASPHNKTELWITFLTTAISPAIPKGAEGEFELSVCFASVKRRL